MLLIGKVEANYLISVDSSPKIIGSSIETVLCLRVVPLGGKDCDHDLVEGVKVCNGAVTREKETTVQICVDGKLKYKKKEEVTPGYALWPRDTGPGKDCVWYGTTFCDGDLVEVTNIGMVTTSTTIFTSLLQDLRRWKYHLKCSKGVMRVVGRTLSDLVAVR